MSKASRRKERNLKKRRSSSNFQAVMNHTPSPNSEHKCIFCGSTHDLQRHHCWQKRFGGPDSADNLVWICPNCHRTFHIISDINLNHIVRHRNIENHEVRPVTPAIEPKPKELPPVQEVERTVQPITISGGTVTINFK